MYAVTSEESNSAVISSRFSAAVRRQERPQTLEKASGCGAVALPSLSVRMVSGRPTAAQASLSIEVTCRDGGEKCAAVTCVCRAMQVTGGVIGRLGEPHHNANP